MPTLSMHGLLADHFVRAAASYPHLMSRAQFASVPTPVAAGQSAVPPPMALRIGTRARNAGVPAKEINAAVEDALASVRAERFRAAG